MFLLAALAACLLPGLSAGCRPAPEGPRPPRIPGAEGVRFDPDVSVLATAELRRR